MDLTINKINISHKVAKRTKNFFANFVALWEIKKTKFILKKVILYTLAASLISCEFSLNREDDQKDDNYPTMFYCLSKETLSQMRSDFAQKNPYAFSNLNQFGFCALVDDTYGTQTPSGSFTKYEAIDAVKEFVARNPKYTGVNNPNDLLFKSITNWPSELWVIVTENQQINNVEVYFTSMVFHTVNRSVTGCWGYYFSYVYVPEKFNFDVERAKSQLLGKEVFLYTIAGEKYSLGKVKAQHLQECIANLIIVPIRTEEKIELRVTWQIRLDSMPYIYYIDVMTGEIVQEEPTIIS